MMYVYLYVLGVENYVKHKLPKGKRSLRVQSRSVKVLLHIETAGWMGTSEEDTLSNYVISMKLEMKFILLCFAHIITIKDCSYLTKMKSRR